MITTASGTKLYIGPAFTQEPTLVNFEAITEGDWELVNEVSSLGEFGDEAAEVNFSAIGDGRVRKLKGARDAGTMAVVVGRDPLDDGQRAMVAAEKTKFRYAFKVVAEDAPSEEFTNSEYYFVGLVMSRRENYGENDNVVTITFNVGVDSEIIEVPSEEIIEES